MALTLSIALWALGSTYEMVIHSEQTAICARQGAVNAGSVDLPSANKQEGELAATGPEPLLISGRRWPP